MQGKTVVLNSSKVNFDGKIDHSGIAPQVIVYEDTAPELILERVADCEILVTKELPMGGDLIRSLPDTVKLICEAGTGYNNIDLAAARERGITVCNIPAYSTQRVAHLAIAMMLNMASSLHRQQAMLAQGNRDNFTKHLMVEHREINGKTLGIIGAGTIGREVIKVAQALDMKILASTRNPRTDENGIHYVSVEELLRESDYVSLHCPLTPDTRHLINEKTLAMMKPSAYLINTSRGALVDEAALVKALEAGQLAGAGLDVQEQEPPVEGSPLYTLENVMLTPHIGWKGLETRERLVSILGDNIRAYLAGSPINVVG